MRVLSSVLASEKKATATLPPRVRQSEKRA
jgi:hypothetical protein